MKNRPTKALRPTFEERVVSAARVHYKFVAQLGWPSFDELQPEYRGVLFNAMYAALMAAELESPDSGLRAGAARAAIIAGVPT